MELVHFQLVLQPDHYHNGWAKQYFILESWTWTIRNYSLSTMAILIRIQNIRDKVNHMEACECLRMKSWIGELEGASPSPAGSLPRPSVSPRRPRAPRPLRSLLYGSLPCSCRLQLQPTRRSRRLQLRWMIRGGGVSVYASGCFHVGPRNIFPPSAR